MRQLKDTVASHSAAAAAAKLQSQETPGASTVASATALTTESGSTVTTAPADISLALAEVRRQRSLLETLSKFFTDSAVSMTLPQQAEARTYLQELSDVFALLSNEQTSGQARADLVVRETRVLAQLAQLKDAVVSQRTAAAETDTYGTQRTAVRFLPTERRPPHSARGCYNPVP